MSLLKNPATIVSGLFAAVAALFNIPFVDGIALWLWSNANQLFLMSSIGVTVSEQLPFPEKYAIQALIATGVILLAKLLLDAGNDLEDSIDDS
ncbi:hypothetical protein [Halorubrum lipolyticum]|uniref:Uncharacterized protein n=1 Tax=Halorubrum lipolyticum DSM 21995 TaxID=1227482 RepID=M0P749_9EURY|nr:hypothetical protein [Halorubrum lipolyticum]EMA64665.1 hypothetical protein C469_00375 [Halorubrum lipolyticum DSM 21995]